MRESTRKRKGWWEAPPAPCGDISVQNIADAKDEIINKWNSFNNVGIVVKKLCCTDSEFEAIANETHRLTKAVRQLEEAIAFSSVGRFLACYEIIGTKYLANKNL